MSEYIYSVSPNEARLNMLFEKKIRDIFTKPRQNVLKQTNRKQRRLTVMSVHTWTQKQTDT